MRKTYTENVVAKHFQIEIEYTKSWNHLGTINICMCICM